MVDIHLPHRGMAAPEVIRPGRVPPEAYVRFVASVREYAMLFLDPDGRIASWNTGAAEIFGHAEKDVLGQHASVLYTPRDASSRKPQFDLRVASTEGRHEDEDWRARHDGTMFWAGVVLTAVRNGHGTLMGFAQVTRDLTDRKHADEALRQSEERHRLLVESVKDYAIFVLDERGRILSWNEGARRLKGYEADEIIGEHFSRFYTRADIARRHPEHELEIAKAEGRYEEEGWRLRKDGTAFWARVTITALRDSKGRHVGFAKVTRDLTARRQTEEALTSRVRSFERRNRELDAFSHTVAHDLRSPIRAIEHLSRVLEEDEGARLSENGREVLRAMGATSRHMAKLVEDLLEFSTASGSEPTRARVDVTEIARDVGDDLVRRQSGRAIEITVAPGLHARADAGLLRIALTNLLGNAVKFTRNVPRARIEVGEEDTPEGPAFFVRDNGAGFEPARAGALFQPFSRLHGANEFEGTGIGLATVDRIVRRHGGTVWAKGKVGEGATFYFTIPDERA